MKKHNRTIIQSIKKDIIKGYKRFFWFFYTKLKYFFYFDLNFRKSTNNKEFKISLLLPSRERSKKFIRLLDSINKTCFIKNRLEILLLIDEDDNETDKYQSIILSEKYKKLDIKFFSKNFETHAIRNNFLAKNSTGEIIFPINDDMIFISNNWDKEIDKVFIKVSNQAYCLWVNSGLKYNHLHCDFPMVNRKWYEKLGYVGSEFFKFWYLDAWICDLSFKSKKFFITNKIKTFQFSAHTIKSEVDDTHLKNLKNNIPENDFITWHNTNKYRIKDAKKLK
tara:strand:+ start:14 stop:850 length:837 start_codon:yes stop_codon:yes gene_type:complete